MKKEKVDLSIQGMTCLHCADSIAKRFEGKPGILSKVILYPDGKGSFSYDSDLISKEEIAKTINQTGHYKVAGEINTPHEDRSDTTRQIGQQAPSSILDSQTIFDLIIIGGGSSAFAAAIYANEQGLTTLIVNAGLPTGGTCVNVGCVPSKFLIRAAESIHQAAHSPFRGVHPGKPSWDYKQIIEEKRELVEGMREKKYEDILKGLEYVKAIEGRAEFVDSRTIQVNGQSTFTSLKIIIATGSSTFIPAIEGLEQVNYLTHRSLFELEELPESLTIIGAGYIALEIAQAYHRLGSKVRILQRSQRILSSQGADVTNELARHLQEEGIEILTDTLIERVEQVGGTIQIMARVKGETHTFTSSHLLLAAGTKANTARMGLEKIGLVLEESGHVNVNSRLETSIPNIYAIGDVTSNPAYVYTAAYEGKLAVKNAFNGAGLETDFTALPWVIFTDPQVAGAGLDEVAAQALGIPVESSTLPLSEVPRSAVALNTKGFIKLIRNRETDQLIGARIVAPEGGELISQISLAIRCGMTVEGLATTLYPYLTLSEGIKLAALAFSRDIAKLSCCAS